ncbi:CotH kinase protein [anaerobic digester metagenome]
MKRLSAILILITSCTFLHAQPLFPADGEVYIKSTVPRIDVLIHPDTLSWIYANVESDHEFRAVFVFDNGNVHDTIRDIGFRLRGNTSRYSQKKSFKVSFNTFISGRKYHGVEKLNLNGEHNDPSVSRAGIYWDILRQCSLAGPRYNHVRVYINGNYHGLYINVEHIDEEFAKTWFGNNDGNLYKCLYPADLTYRGSNPDLYKFESGGRRAYELKINEEADDYSDLAHFIDVLNNTPLQQLPCALEKVFNVQDYLKVAAVDIITGNWDGYIYNKNNFYLYHNIESGLFEYIPYDVDNTFGIDWFGIEWASRNIYSWAHPSEPRPLFTRLMQVPDYKAQFTYYLKQAIQQVTSRQDFLDNLFIIRDRLQPFVANDPYYPLDYGYTIASFNQSFEAGTGAHVPVGLLPYLQTRNTTALDQALNMNAPPMIRYIRHNAPLPFQEIRILALAEDENLNSVTLEYRINGDSWQQKTMTENRLNNNTALDGGTFIATLSGLDANTLLEFRIKATDNNQVTVAKPCDAVQYTIPSPNPIMLYINEFMASNSSTIADEYGEYDDWIEIYNAGSQAVWLGDKYLSDNLNNPVKWAFPDTTIGAGGYLLVWADGQPTQGSMHTPYKLDKDNEEIGIFDNEASGFALIDDITYTNQSTNISMGRVTDGAVEWKLFDNPTPGSTNSMVGIPEIPAYRLNIYPNPSNTGFIYLEEFETISIFDLSGREILPAVTSQKIDIGSLKPGIYLVRNTTGGVAKLMVN